MFFVDWNVFYFLNIVFCWIDVFILKIYENSVENFCGNWLSYV